MTAIEEAILRTVIYADIFSFPLTRAELAHYLISSTPASAAEIDHALASSPLLRRELESSGDYVICAGRGAILGLRAERERASQRLWPHALRYGERLAGLPFVRMVALTGALAVRNAAAHDDDLDYVVVTAAGRVWLARAFAILLVRLARRRGIVVCPNYVLAASALAQEPHSLFMAHEIAQMVPIYGRDVYAALRASNGWVAAQLANATNPYYEETEHQPSRGARWLKRAAEWLLGGRLGDALERWEYRRKLRRFAPELRTPHSAAQLDDQHVKGHFQDHGHPVMTQYAERMRRYESAALPLTGD